MSSAVFKSRHLDDIATFIAGALLPFAFAPFRFYPLAILCPAALLMLWLRTTNTKQVFIRGLLFGLGEFGVGASWIYVSVHQFGNAGVLLAGGFTAIFVLILALFPAVQGYVWSRFFPRPNNMVLCLAFPSSWAIFEWIRSWFCTGFPWLLLGASQTASPLRGFAPIIGEYGVSFVVVLTSTLLIIALKAKRQWYKSVIAILIIWAIGASLVPIHWTHPVNQPIKVSLIQGDVPQADKWTTEYMQSTLMRYYQFTAQHWDSKLIIWPETAIPLLKNDAQAFLDSLDNKAKQHHVAVITGIPVQDGFTYYNAMIVLGDGEGLYYKRHLVPFGEYVPMINWLGGLLGFLNIPMSSFSAGPSMHPPIRADGFIIAPFICYEVAYEQTVLQELPQATLLVTISNDAWFGHSFASAQHVQIGQLRAIETGRYHVFTTNSGITAIINPQGKIQASAPSFEPVVLTGTIQPMAGMTPIAWLGVMPIIGLMIFLFLLALWFTYRRNHHEH